MVTALTLQIKSNSDTVRTLERIADLRNNLSQVNEEMREARRNGNQGVYRRTTVEAAALRTEITQLNRRLREQTQELDAVGRVPGSYNDLRNQVVRLTAEYRELGREAREGIVGQELLNRIQRLNTELNEIQTNLSPFRQSLNGVVAGFNQFNAILGAAGIFVGLSEFVQLVGQSIRTFADFEQQVATLGAVTGAAGQDLAALEQDARRLGESTQFTATQVAELQVILGRRGFSPDQIIDATEAITNLSIATQENLGETADVISAVIQGYGLQAEDAVEITDTLTEAFNTSALQLSTFAEASEQIAPVANTLGIPLSEATATIGLLANAGLEGTIATRTLGTALQRLSDDTSVQAEAARELGVEIFNQNGEFVGLANVLGNLEEATAGFSEQQRLAAVSQIFGQEATRNFAALLEGTFDTFQDGEPVTLRGAQALEAYIEQLQNAEGQAAATAAVVGDTLAQDLLRAQSAIEGLQLNLVELFEGGLRSVVQGFTTLVDIANEFLSVPVSQQLREEQTELNALVGALANANNSEETRSRLIAQIQAQYPDFVKNIDLENATTEELQQALEQVNNEYRQRILLQVANEQVQERQEELQERINRQTEDLVTQTRNLQSAQELLGDSSLTVDEALEQLRERGARLVSQFGGVGQSASRLDQVYSNLSRSAAGFAGSTDRAEQAQNRLNTAQEEAANTLDIIREQYPEIAALLEDTTASNENLKDSIEEPPEPNNVTSPLQKEAEAAQGSIEDLQNRIAALQEDINSSNDIQVIQPLVQELEGLEKELEEAQQQIESFRTSALDLENINSSLNVNLGFEDLNETLEGSISNINTDNLEDTIREINRVRLQAVAAARPSEEAEEEAFQEKRKQINAEADITILQARADLLEPNSVERLEIEQQIADKRVAISKQADQQIERDRGQLEQRLFDVGFKAAQDTANAIFSIQENNIQRQLTEEQQRLNRETELRIEQAQGNQDLITQIEAEAAQRSEELQAEAARQEKDIAIKKALINGALGITKAFAELLPPFNFIQAAAIAASTAAQVAVINSQEFAEGGLVRDLSNHNGLIGGSPNIKAKPNGDNILATVRTGEVILNKRQQAALGGARTFASIGVPGFVEGGLVERTPQLINPNTSVPAASGGSSTVRLNPADIELIADRIAARNAAATRNAIGMGLNDANRRLEREEIAQNELNI